MPLFHKKPFELESVPADLKPDEEVFLCPATQEIFRDYESFFNRMFLCNRPVWTCALTGTSGITFTEAVESEQAARKMLDSLNDCHKKAALELIHHAPRTNVKTMAEEICLFYRDRFVLGEIVDMTTITTFATKIVKHVKIIEVIVPSSPSPPRATSPIKSPNESTVVGQICFTSPQPKIHSNNSSPVLKSPEEKLTNGLSLPDEDKGETADIQKSPSEGRIKGPQTPKVPISPHTGFEPSLYRYLVEDVQSSEQQTVKAFVLNRARGVFTPKKLRVFLRNATYRTNEKQPFVVKEEFVTKFDLGGSSIDFTLYQRASKSSRKSYFSQSRLDSFLSPSSSQGCIFPDGDLSESSTTKSLSSSRVIKGVKGKKGKKTNRKKLSYSSRIDIPTSAKKKKKKQKEIKLSKSYSTPCTPKSPIATNSHSQSYCSVNTPKSPRTKAEALKLLNKAKRFKQMDLKKSVINANDLKPAELVSLKERKRQDRERMAAMMEENKRKRREERLRQMRGQQEQRRLQKLKKREWLKPREDLTCEDSLPLPEATGVKTSLPHELFVETVMVLEFLHTFGPLFDRHEFGLKGTITFEKLEYAITTQEMDSKLFEIVKFLLQATFATMKEEHEYLMVPVKHARKCLTQATTDSKNRNESSPTSNSSTVVGGGKEGEKDDEREGNETSGLVISDDDVTDEERERSLTPLEGREGGEEQDEGEKDNEGEGDDASAPIVMSDDDVVEEGEVEEQPLDECVETIKSAAVGHSQWSIITQFMSLHKLVVDAYTITEILRLHLLSCGGYQDSRARRHYRLHRRGGFSDADDPSMDLRLNRPDVCAALVEKSIYSLSPEEKLVVLSVLCLQLLTYAASRDFLNDLNARAKKENFLMVKLKSSVDRIKRDKATRMKKQCQEQQKDKLGEGQKLRDDQDKSMEMEDQSFEGGVINEATSVLVKEGKPPAAVEGEVMNEATSVLAKEGQPPAAVEGEVMNEATSVLAKEGQPPGAVEGEVMNEAVSFTAKEEPCRTAETALSPAAGTTEDKPQPQAFVDVKDEVSGADLKLMEDEIAARRKVAREAALSVRIQSIGEDRYHRKFWVFPHLLGLFAAQCTDPFVEDADLNCKAASEQDVRTPVTVSSAPVDPSTEPQSQHATDRSINVVLEVASHIEGVTSLNATPVATGTVSQPLTKSASPLPSPPLQRSPPGKAGNSVKWLCYSTKEQIDSFITSLNPRGVRESELKKKLLKRFKDDQFSSSKCIFEGDRVIPSSIPKYKNTEVIFELYLREKILDIEEKIFIGNLGAVGDRIVWRSSIENSGAAAAITYQDPVKKKEDSSPSTLTCSSFSPTAVEGDVCECVAPSPSVVEELANCLLQVQDGISKRFLLAPLGKATEKKKKSISIIEDNQEEENRYLGLDQWRSSLRKASTFSQIFLHLATLERGIMWSKSLMKVRCRKCFRKCAEDFMLLCDGCDLGYHTYCLDPPLEEVPEGDWFCSECAHDSTKSPVEDAIPAMRLRKPRVNEEDKEGVLNVVDKKVISKKKHVPIKYLAVDRKKVLKRKGCRRGNDTSKRMRDSKADEDEHVTDPLPSKKKSLTSYQTVGKGSGRTRKRLKDNEEGEYLPNLPDSKKILTSYKTMGKGSTRASKRMMDWEDGDGAEDIANLPPSKKSRTSYKTHSRGGNGKTGKMKAKSLHNNVKKQQSLVHSGKKLKLVSPCPQPSVLISKAEEIIASIIEVRSSPGGRRPTGSLKKELIGLQTQLCYALWEEVSFHKDSWHFATPVKKKEYPDYLDVVPVPMDLSTVKGRIKCGGYSNIDEFLRDMFLIFSNSAKYRKHHINVKKAGSSLKRHFKKRCDDLCLKDLQVSGLDWTNNSEQVVSSRRQSSRLKH